MLRTLLSTEGPRLHIVGADDPVRPVPLSFRASARTGAGIRFPLPPSSREVAARSADGGSDIARQFLSPSRLRRQPPPSGGLAARRCRADGTSYPKGICSAALHCRTPSPTGGSTHLPRRATRPQAAVYPRRRFLPCSGAKHPPVMQCVHLPSRRQHASSHPLTCHGMVPQAYRTHFSGITKPRDFRRGVSCWRYLSSQAVSSQVLSAEASLTDLSRDGAAGIPNSLFRHNKAPRLSSRGFVLALPIFPGRLQPSIVSRSELN